MLLEWSHSAASSRMSMNSSTSSGRVYCLDFGSNRGKEGRGEEVEGRMSKLENAEEGKRFLFSGVGGRWFFWSRSANAAKNISSERSIFLLVEPCLTNMVPWTWREEERNGQ
jgi:hypothetical protein